MDMTAQDFLAPLPESDYSKGYKAGQQSRQGEVDALHLKYSRDSRMLHNVIEMGVDERTGLQNRIDDALNKLCQLQYASAERVYHDVSKILRGN